MEKKDRYHLLDVIRGITLISMICYHGSWDLVYLMGVGGAFRTWYEGPGAFVWQQSICWTFILLSGFCIPLSKKRFKRGLVVFGAGLLVSAVTIIFMYEDRVVFGVLTFIGSAMLILALVYPYIKKVPALPGEILSWYLFYMFRHVNSGFLQAVPGVRIPLPDSLYHGMAASYLGFMERGFYSTDYFSLLPWIFLYFAGVYLYLLLEKGGILEKKIMRFNIRPLSFPGRHSLLIYLLHQPVLYGVFMLLAGLGVSF